jgi:hypothetical protein
MIFGAGDEPAPKSLQVDAGISMMANSPLHCPVLIQVGQFGLDIGVKAFS